MAHRKLPYVFVACVSLLIGTLAIVILIRSDRTGTSVDVDNATAERLQSEIEDLPSWLSSSDEWQHGKTKYLALSSRLPQYETPIIRAAFLKVISYNAAANGGTASTDTFGKLFVVLRMLFVMKNDETGLAYGGNFKRRNSESMSWPLIYDPANFALVDIEQCGGYVGDNYLIIDEFDDFALKYERRKP
jgi:hypothetical protein